jgi:hypothetical protein
MIKRKEASEPCPSIKDKGKRIRDKPVVVTRDRAPWSPRLNNCHPVLKDKGKRIKPESSLSVWAGYHKGILKGKMKAEL